MHTGRYVANGKYSMDGWSGSSNWLVRDYRKALVHWAQGKRVELPQVDLRYLFMDCFLTNIIIYPFITSTIHIF